MGMSKTVSLLVEGMERLGLIGSRIRQNEGMAPKIETDIILQELRDLYMVALRLEAENSVGSGDDVSAAKKAAEEAAAKKAAEEAAAKKAAEEAAAKKAAEEAAAKKAAEEAAAKKAAEEAAAKKAAEEAAAKKAAEEAAAKKAAEEAAAKKAAEEMPAPIFAEEPTVQEEAPLPAPEMEEIEGRPNDEIFEELSAPESKQVPAPETKQASKPESKQAPESPKAAGTSLLEFLQVEHAEEQPRVRTIADTFSRPTRSVDEQVAPKKVTDLRTVININDKFSFMCELFRNNMKAYNDFILKLNATTSREEALGYMEQEAKAYQWDENSVAVKNFYKIFDRKF